jgi:hypothetical protein
VVADRRRRGERFPGGRPLAQRPSRELDCGLELRGLGRSDPGCRAERTGLGGEQPGERAELREEVAPEVDRTPAPATDAEKDREELGVGEALGAPFEQLLPRPLTRRPVCDAYLCLPEACASSRRISRTS